ncbi:MAG: hypothetical protein H7836_08800 [Magnetococcus sp. YQC-3]
MEKAVLTGSQGGLGNPISPERRVAGWIGGRSGGDGLSSAGYDVGTETKTATL